MKDDIEQPLTSHITPPDDNYVVPTTNLIVVELKKEFGGEILGTTVIDMEINVVCKPII